jgi:hypothetical protein
VIKISYYYFSIFVLNDLIKNLLGVLVYKFPNSVLA